MDATSHKALIEAIGPNVVKARYALSRQRLHQWTKRGIPYGHRVAVAKLAAEQGVAVPLTFFDPPPRRVPA